MYKNEIIQCPNCNLDLYVALKDQYAGEILKSCNFKGIGNVPDPKPGTYMLCPECNSCCGLGKKRGRVYIKNVGWAGGISSDSK